MNFFILFGMVGIVLCLENPLEFYSINGVLSLTLQVEPSNITIANDWVMVTCFNGSYIPPTLRMNPGDFLRLTDVNLGTQSTNLHFHGLHVTPKFPGDDPFLEFIEGNVFQYSFQISPNQPPGLYWYHTHAHGLTQFQTFNGIAGAFVIEGILNPFPSLQNIVEKIILFNDIQIANHTVRQEIEDFADTIHLVNGIHQPTASISPNEVQFWRIANIGANLYYNVSFSGLTVYEVAIDGNRHNALLPKTVLLIEPSSRVEIFVIGPKIGNYSFSSSAYDTGEMGYGDSYPEADLFFVISSGIPVTSLPLPNNFPSVPDLRTRTVNNVRNITFSQTKENDTFFINSKQYDPNRIDTVVTFGDLELWALINLDYEQHIFHIHQMSFQVIEINGVPQNFDGYRDNVNMPPRTVDSASVVKILLDFGDPNILGTFLYHCHIMEHEDKKMMAVIQVIPAPVVLASPMMVLTVVWVLVAIFVISVILGIIIIFVYQKKKRSWKTLKEDYSFQFSN